MKWHLGVAAVACAALSIALYRPAPAHPISLGPGLTANTTQANLVWSQVVNEPTQPQGLPSFSAAQVKRDAKGHVMLREAGEYNLGDLRNDRYSREFLLGLARAARANPLAPKLVRPMATLRSFSASPRTSGVGAQFDAQGDYFLLQPPDMAVAATTTQVFEGVNLSYGVYSTAGKTYGGWPKSYQSFFNAPNYCGGAPFFSDPRAIYDQFSKRYFSVMVEVDAAYGCGFREWVWIATSQSSDARLKWNVAAYDVGTALLGFLPDFPEIGADENALYLSFNRFGGPTGYDGTAIYSVSKAALESGRPPARIPGFTGISSNGAPLDTVQPVVVLDSNPNPGVELFVATRGFADPCITTLCSGGYVFAMTNGAKSNPTLTGSTFSSKAYAVPPLADDTACMQCIETVGPRITHTPFYRNRLISFAITTALYNGTQNVAGTYWAKLAPSVTNNGHANGGTITQDGYLAFTGDESLSFAVPMMDTKGNTFLGFDTASTTLNESIAYLTIGPSGSVGAPSIIATGPGPFSGFRWGDYEAAAWTPNGDIWYASEYTVYRPLFGGFYDWLTHISEYHF